MTLMVYSILLQKAMHTPTVVSFWSTADVFARDQGSSHLQSY